MPLRILGLDPGYGRLGYAVVEQQGSEFKALDYGVIETSAKSDFDSRLLTLASALEVLVKKHLVKEAALETLYFSKNVKTALKVAEARGALRLTLARLGVNVLEINPSEVKLALGGHGQADKKQIQRMVTRLLNLKSIPQPDDAADALAQALTAFRSRPLRLLKAKLKKPV